MVGTHTALGHMPGPQQRLHGFNHLEPPIIIQVVNQVVNLQDGGHILVWFGLTWSLTEYLQTVARLWRQGQTKPVIVHQIVAEGTVHEVMVQAIEDKETNQRELLHRVRMSIE